MTSNERRLPGPGPAAKKLQRQLAGLGKQEGHPATVPPGAAGPVRVPLFEVEEHAGMAQNDGNTFPLGSPSRVSASTFVFGKMRPGQGGTPSTLRPARV
jgi:hypothetical protein